MRPAAVIFDLDGVLVDSEQLWDRIRRDVVAEYGGEWRDGATEAMLGMSTPEWSRYLVATLGVTLTPEEAAEIVIDRMARRYADGHPPVLPNAAETLRAVAARYPIAIASSAPARIIRAFLEATGLVATVGYTLSSENVRAGKPAPDVYLHVARGLDVTPEECAAVEDSSNGLRSAASAGMTVLAIPNPHFPPAKDALTGAHRVLASLDELPDALSDLTNC